MIGYGSKVINKLLLSLILLLLSYDNLMADRGITNFHTHKYWDVDSTKVDTLVFENVRIIVKLPQGILLDLDHQDKNIDTKGYVWVPEIPTKNNKAQIHFWHIGKDFVKPLIVPTNYYKKSSFVIDNYFKDEKGEERFTANDESSYVRVISLLKENIYIFYNETTEDNINMLDNIFNNLKIEIIP